MEINSYHLTFRYSFRYMKIMFLKSRIWETLNCSRCADSKTNDKMRGNGPKHTKRNRNRQKRKKKKKIDVSQVLCHMSCVVCHLSLVPCHLSLPPTTTATDPFLANFPTIQSRLVRHKTQNKEEEKNKLEKKTCSCCLY